MRHLLSGLILSLGLICVLPGCGGGSAVELPPEVQYDPVAQFRKDIELYAESGQTDSGIMVLKETVEGFPEDKLPNKAEVVAAVDELVNAKGSGDVKKAAQNVLDKLPPPSAQ